MTEAEPAPPCGVVCGIANSRTGSMKLTLVLAGAMLAAAPALAQSADPASPRTPLPADRGYDKPDPRTDAINAPNRAELAATNNAANVASSAATAASQANVQAAYDYDMANYLDALRAHDARAARDRAHYEHQQRAYADAMRVWRTQVYDCNRGIIAACRAPTPNPAAFW